MTDRPPPLMGSETSRNLYTASEEARKEAMNAMGKWPPHNSAHEAYAILLEEVDELWEHVKTNQKKRDIEAMRKECIQVAAMALRFAVECCETNGNGYGK